jgi:hypothetical protein
LSKQEPLASIAVGVVVERRKGTTQWADFVWRPVAALPGVPDTAAWTVLAADDARATLYAGGAEIALYRTETANYRDNLASGAPALWVVLRPTAGEPPYDLVLVTADPSEGEAYTESGADLVDSVPMPDTVRAALEEFVAAHHVEQPFHKRERTRANPEASGRAPAAKGERT